MPSRAAGAFGIPLCYSEKAKVALCDVGGSTCDSAESSKNDGEDPNAVRDEVCVALQDVELLPQARRHGRHWRRCPGGYGCCRMCGSALGHGNSLCCMCHRCLPGELTRNLVLLRCCGFPASGQRSSCAGHGGVEAHSAIQEAPRVGSRY